MLSAETTVGKMLEVDLSKCGRSGPLPFSFDAIIAKLSFRDVYSTRSATQTKVCDQTCNDPSQGFVCNQTQIDGVTWRGEAACLCNSLTQRGKG